MRPRHFKSLLACALFSSVILFAVAGPAQAATTKKPRVPDPVALLANDALSALASLRTVRGAHLVDLTVPGLEQGRTQVDVAGAAYAQAISLLAEAVSPRASTTSSATLLATWTATPDARMIVVLSALGQVGTPYRWLGSTPGAFDCSGLVQWAWSQVGITLPHSARAQIRAAAARQPYELKAGDIVYHRDHVSMYLGAGNAIVNAPRTGRLVEIRDWGRETKFGTPLT